MSLRRRAFGIAVRGLLAAIAFIVSASSVSAVPVFARKYQTSCQTCHIVFPKLNAFGEAFRLRGYRMPGETEEMVKVPPVPLGAPAYKRLWPEAVWPGEISSAVPLAVIIKLGDSSYTTLNADGSITSIENDLQFPQELNLFGAGTLGDHVSFYSEVTFSENPDGSASVELEHAHMGFDSPFGPEDLFHFRIGKFNPNLIDGFGETWLSTNARIDSLFNYNPIGVNGGFGLGADAVSPSPIALPTLVRGVEGYGIIRHRALWVAGLSNGLGPLPSDTTGRFDGNDSKDVWARFDYKIGGMGLDGYTGGQPYLPEKNWRDNSLRLGAFVYRGNASNINFPVTLDTGIRNIQDVHFHRSGLYANLFLGDLNVFGVYLHGEDTLSLFDPTSNALLSTIEPEWHAWFTQADYVIFPWLQAGFRYETVTPADRSVEESLRSGIFNLSALVRANVKAMIEYQRDLRQGSLHSLDLLLRFGF
jgi:hypothetical protein